MSKYKKGEIVFGCVTGIEKYGIFVNLDEYYSGLIHISEVSNAFVRNIHDYVKVGETIKVKVLDTNERWFGVTYKEDKKDLVSAINKMIEEGKYPKNLWS